MMSTPEERVVELNLESTEAHIRAESKRLGGRTSLMFAIINAGAGGFMADCLLHMLGKAEHMSMEEQALIIAGSGLVAATAILRRAYRHNGINLAENFQWRRESRHAYEIGEQANELASWVVGPNELSAGGEATVDQFKSELDKI